MKNIPLILLLSLTSTAFAETGKQLHDSSCASCHMVTHNKDFYGREGRKIQDLFALKGQVSRCSQAFSTGWFPEEEASVVQYLNQEFYHFSD